MKRVLKLSERVKLSVIAISLVSALVAYNTSREAFCDRNPSDERTRESNSDRTLELKTPYPEKLKWLNDVLTLPALSERNGKGILIQRRAVFDEDIGWALSRGETDRILSRVSRAGFNVYIPCVWHGKGAHFPSHLAKPDPRLRRRIESGDDPLAYLVRKAHSMGIEVHPWFTVALRMTEEYPSFHGKGVPDGAFDIHNSDFRSFIVDLMLDVMKRYDVDGINLDYIRSMGICSSDSCRVNYERFAGYPFLPDYALSGARGAARERICRWQERAVSDIVRRVSEGTRRIKPCAIISVDGNPGVNGGPCSTEGRAEKAWADNGWIDVIYAMDYRERIDFVKIDLVRRELRDGDKLTVLFGNFDKKGVTTVARSGDLVAGYAEFARRKWPRSGIALYLYGKLTDEQIEALRSGPFSERAMARPGGCGRGR